MAANNDQKRGLGVDSRGGPVIDPTANVIALVEANAKASAALRDADVRFNDAQNAHLKEISNLRAEQTREVRAFDSDRYDKIRSVDMANAASTAAQILQAVNTNAAVAATTALTLAKQVTDTAAAQEARQGALATDMAKRLSAVELSMSKGEGKQQVADPALERLALIVEKLAAAQQAVGGRSEGIDATWKMVIIGGGLVLAFLTYQSRNAATAQPQVIMLPAPVTAPPTTTTTTTAPFPR
jgi:hypothetical protein